MTFALRRDTFSLKKLLPRLAAYHYGDKFFLRTRTWSLKTCQTGFFRSSQFVYDSLSLSLSLSLSRKRLTLACYETQLCRKPPLSRYLDTNVDKLFRTLAAD